jgi:hypothetical protein
MIDLDDLRIDRQTGFRLWAVRFLGNIRRDMPDKLAWMA